MLFRNVMPMLYMATDGAEGASGEAATIDWSKVDPASIPEDLLKKNPAYTKVLNETIERRQEINKVLKPQLQSLQDQLSKLSPGDEKPKDEPKTDNTQNATLEQLLKDLTAKVDKISGDKLVDWQKQAADVTGLKSPKIYSKLEGSSYEEVLKNAQEIATEMGVTPPKRQEPGMIGNPAGERNKGLQEEVRKRMMGRHNTSFMSPDFQKTIGGGVVDNTGN